MAKVLVIDDDLLVRAMVRHMLEQAGYEVMDAEDGTVAVELCGQSPPDLVITDINMPGKDGWETIVALRGEYPDLKIIAISGGDQQQTSFNLSLSTRLGADRIFTKPVPKAELLAAVAELLDGVPSRN